MHILLINLTRLGDLLQTQPVIHGLKAEDHTTGLICLENFVDAANCLSDLDHVYPFPSNTISASLNGSWYNSIHKLHAWIENIKKTFHTDYIINLTPTIPARTLAQCISMAHNAELKGFSIDLYGFGNCDSMWAKFFESTTLKRNCSPYNIVDLFRKIAHVGHIPSKYQLKKPSDIKNTELSAILAAQQTPIKPYIGLQLGASAPCRQWPISHFAYLGTQLYQEFGITPILLGHISEKHLADKYKQIGAPCIDLIGKTSLQDLASVLSSLSILITNDTGTMHLAAGLGVPSLAIFLATAQAYDTAPYLEDCCCVEPALACHPCEFDTKCPYDLMCHNQILPEHIWMLIEKRIKNRTWPEDISSDITSKTRVWLTKKDSIGFLDLHSISKHDKEDRSVWFCIQRHYYCQFLDKMDSLQKNLSYKPIPKKMYLLSTDFKQDAYQTLSYISSLLTLLIAQGSSLSAQSQPQIKKKFLTTTEQITTILTNSSQFNVLGRIWSVSIQDYGHDFQQVLTFCMLFHVFIEAWQKDLSTAL